MKPINWKKYRIVMYKNGKRKNMLEMYGKYEDIEKGVLNKAIVFKNQNGLYLDVHFLSNYDRIEVFEIR